METFDFQADWGMERRHQPEVIQLKFGDGYEQVAPKGIHHNLRHYALTFTGSTTRINSILDFLNRHAGYKAFYWTPYGATEGKFRASNWNTTYQNGFATLSTEFREVVG